MRGTRRALGMAAAALLVAASSACGPSYRGEPVYGPLSPVDPQVASGERLFMRHCHECHPGGSTGLAPALNDRPAPGWLIRFQVRHGLGAMPAFDEARISDDELDDVIAYLLRLRAQQPREAP